ncbi:DNA sulfur modification protein DndB [Bacillus sp. 1P06AnD]|uniref:DNA sulfur modification protein DndB n=1 Tax=Bacillus sp. 1P06AnD TaxID=3132208 RepID=UPI0039A00BB4
MIEKNVFDKRQTMGALTIKEIKQLYQDGNLILRDTVPNHVRRIRYYIKNNVLNGDIYFPPIVAAITFKVEGEGVPGCYEVIDGSHRLKAFMQLNGDYMKVEEVDGEGNLREHYKLIELLEQTRITFQCLSGLSNEEKDQLYIDLNTKGKKVALSKRISFDSRSPLNQITNDILRNTKDLMEAGVETEKRAVIRPANQKLLSLSQLKQIVSVFLYGKAVMQEGEENRQLIYMDSNEYAELISLWFQELFVFVNAKKIGNYHLSMLASFPLLMAIAMYVNDRQLKRSFIVRKKEMLVKMHGLRHIDWRSQNPKWTEFEGKRKGVDNYFYLASNKENFKKLIDMLKREEVRTM